MLLGSVDSVASNSNRRRQEQERQRLAQQQKAAQSSGDAVNGVSPATNVVGNGETPNGNHLGVQPGEVAPQEPVAPRVLGIVPPIGKPMVAGAPQARAVPAPVAPQPPPPPPPKPADVGLQISTDLEDGNWGQEMVVGLPGPIREFVIAMLHVSRPVRDFPEGFSATWAEKERIRPNVSDRIKQASHLKAMLNAILQVYDRPEEYNGPPIETIAEYMSIVSPLEGDAGNSFQQELEHMSTVLKKRVKPARRVKIPTLDQGLGPFANADVQRMARERETINRLFTKSMAMAFLTRGSERTAATYVFEILMRSFASSLFSHAGEPLAATIEEGLNIFEGKPSAFVTPQQTQQTVSANSYIRGGRIAVEWIRASSDYDAFQEAFFCFLRRFAAMDEESLIPVIDAFENAMGEILKLFTEEAERLAHVNDSFSNRETRANQAAAIDLFIKKLPRMNRREVMNDVALETLVLPTKPRSGNDSDILGVVIKNADPITQSLVQRGPRSAGLFEKIREKVQSGNRTIPLTALLNIFDKDPNGYMVKDPKVTSIKLTEAPHTPGETMVFDEVDPRPLGAGKFFVVHPIRDSKTGNVEVAKIMKPGARQSLKDGVEIASYLAPELAEVVFGAQSGKDSKRLTSQIEREISSLSVELERELDVEITVGNQQEAFRRFNGRKILMHSDEGPVQFTVRVPAIRKAKPGSSMMVMSAVRGIIPTREFVKRHRSAGPLAARVLFDSFFQELVFGPYEDRKELMEAAVAAATKAAEEANSAASVATADAQPANQADSSQNSAAVPTAETADEKRSEVVPASEPEGFATLDGHTGNNPLTYIGVGDESTREYEMWFIDWGLVTRLKMSDIDSLLTLGFGGSINDSDVISQILWELSNAGRASAKDGISADRKSDFAARRKQVNAYVRSKVSDLRANRQYWGPAEWIFHLWRAGLLDFPPNLARLQEGIQAQNETMDTLSAEESDGLAEPGQGPNLIDRLEKRAFWPALESAYKKYGRFRVYWKIGKFFVRDRVQSCAMGLAKAVGIRPQQDFVDPNH